MTTTQIIAAALSPIQILIEDHVRDLLTEKVRRVYARLNEHGMNVNAAFPYPSGNTSKQAYSISMGDYTFSRSWTIRANNEIQQRACWEAGQFFGAPKAPVIVTTIPDDLLKERIDRVAKKEAQDALASYAGKLEGKVRTHFPGKTLVTATYTGSKNPWSHSLLDVAFSDGETGTLKTQMIVNVSPLGTVFNQFPTTRVK